MTNKKEKCPHIEKCKQKILQSDSLLCEERIDDEWSFDDCFKFNDLESNVQLDKDAPTKTAKEWLNS